MSHPIQYLQIQNMTKILTLLHVRQKQSDISMYYTKQIRQVSVCFSKHIHRESGVNQFDREREREQLEDSQRKIQIKRKRRGGERERDEGIGNGRGKKRRDVEIIVPEGSTNRRYTRHPR